ncbi:hypothetical protein Anapl_10713 [Anas platyrhynchos]|uniref:Uncharacterized protein n=1 Tax=Anas platyrhynchos TaxID=8839 RepID=R0LCW4_ANAPL|nr:hypothetical protein Anapl_10713 [Anas platyrhynchos]
MMSFRFSPSSSSTPVTWQGRCLQSKQTLRSLQKNHGCWSCTITPPLRQAPSSALAPLPGTFALPWQQCPGSPRSTTRYDSSRRYHCSYFFKLPPQRDSTTILTSSWGWCLEQQRGDGLVRLDPIPKPRPHREPCAILFPWDTAPAPGDGMVKSKVFNGPVWKKKVVVDVYKAMTNLEKLVLSWWDGAGVWRKGSSWAGGSNVVKGKENNWSRSGTLENPASTFLILKPLGDMSAGCLEDVTLFVPGPSYSLQNELVFITGQKASSRMAAAVRRLALGLEAQVAAAFCCSPVAGEASPCRSVPQPGCSSLL